MQKRLGLIRINTQAILGTPGLLVHNLLVVASPADWIALAQPGRLNKSLLSPKPMAAGFIARATGLASYPLNDA